MCSVSIRSDPSHSDAFRYVSFRLVPICPVPSRSDPICSDPSRSGLFRSISFRHVPIRSVSLRSATSTFALHHVTFHVLPRHFACLTIAASFTSSSSLLLLPPAASFAFTLVPTRNFEAHGTSKHTELRSALNCSYLSRSVSLRSDPSRSGLFRSISFRYDPLCSVSFRYDPFRSDPPRQLSRSITSPFMFCHVTLRVSPSLQALLALARCFSYRQQQASPSPWFPHGTSKRTELRSTRNFEAHGTSKRTELRSTRNFETHGTSKMSSKLLCILLYLNP